MGVGTDLRTTEIIALAACQTLLGGIDPDDPGRLDAVCIALQSDLERSSS